MFNKLYVFALPHDSYEEANVWLKMPFKYFNYSSFNHRCSTSRKLCYCGAVLPSQVKYGLNICREKWDLQSLHGSLIRSILVTDRWSAAPHGQQSNNAGQNTDIATSNLNTARILVFWTVFVTVVHYCHKLQAHWAHHSVLREHFLLTSCFPLEKIAFSNLSCRLFYHPLCLGWTLWFGLIPELSNGSIASSLLGTFQLFCTLFVFLNLDFCHRANVTLMSYKLQNYTEKLIYAL